MKIQPEYKNARYINLQSWIDCEINHPVHGWIPYTLNPNEVDGVIDNVYLIEQITDAAAYVAPTQEEVNEGLAKGIRLERKTILVNTVDPIVSNPLRWAGLTEEEQTEITFYRQSLLDITEQNTFPESVVWPAVPVVLSND
jgi:hypothetical protein